MFLVSCTSCNTTVQSYSYSTYMCTGKPVIDLLYAQLWCMLSLFFWNEDKRTERLVKLYIETLLPYSIGVFYHQLDLPSPGPGEGNAIQHFHLLPPEGDPPHPCLCVTCGDDGSNTLNDLWVMNITGQYWEMVRQLLTILGNEVYCTVCMYVIDKSALVHFVCTC